MRSGLAVRRAALWLPWFLCLLCAAVGGHAALGLPRVDDHGSVLGFGVAWLAVWALGACTGTAQSSFGVDGALAMGSEALLAALALSLWQLGRLPQSLGAPEAETWRLAMAAQKTAFALHDVDRRAVVSLPHLASWMLLDDLLRLIMRFVAGAPWEAWPFALVSRHSYSLWLSNSSWWESCYRDAAWMRLPPNPCDGPSGNHGSDQRRPRPLHLARRLLLVCSVAVEALGAMVIFPPECAAVCWLAAPLVTSTVLAASRGPPLPRWPDSALLVVLEPLRLASRCVVYLQAAWLVSVSFLPLPSPAELAEAYVSKGVACHNRVALCILEVLVLSVLYAVLAGHLWAAWAWCRTARPLYAAPIEAAFPSASSPLEGRPLYCGSLGRGVEGSHAPTRMCDWEDLDGPGLTALKWRDRFALRRRAESLAAREANLLSFLDALDLRLEEAELVAVGARSVASGGRRRCGGAPAVAAASLAATALLASVVVFVVWLWRPRVSGVFEAAFLVSLLARAICHAHTVLIRLASKRDTTARLADLEVLALKHQARALHGGLADTQLQLCRLEVQLQCLNVPLQRRGYNARRPLCALWPLLLCWFCSLAAVCVRTWAATYGERVVHLAAVGGAHRLVM